MILFANPAAERLLDRPSAQVVGAQFGFPLHLRAPGTRSSRPASRVWRLRTNCGSKLPSRSRGVLISTVPSSMRKRFEVEPLRLLPVPPGVA